MHPTDSAPSQDDARLAAAASIRFATPDDADAIAAVYAPYVLHTAISFESVPPAADAFATRIRDAGRTHPWLVAEAGGATPQLVGYAYAGLHRARPAYRWSVETSIYLDAAFHGRGHGRRLYRTLLELVGRQGYAAAYGGLTVPNPASRALHVSVGFETIGTYRRCGWKHGQWHDGEWLQAMLGPSATGPAPLDGADPPEPRAATDADLEAAIAIASVT